jgi:FkbM family methyltransferase
MSYIWNDIFDGDNTFRLDYPLNENSIIFDIGGYKGEFSEKIDNKYHCQIYIFEPVKEFYDEIVEKFKGNINVKVFNFGFSNKNEDIEIKLQDDSSSIIRVNDCQTEIVKMMKLSDFIKLGRNIDLLKLNVEGAEYYILDDLIQSNLLPAINNIQVQFHEIDKNYNKKLDYIRAELNKTHRLTYQFNWIWENWQIRTLPFEYDFEDFNKLIDKYCELDRERLLLAEENNKLKDNQDKLLHECNRYIAQSESDKNDILHQKELNKCQNRN